ncbi:sugar transferase [Aestuariivita boseongensis]|uniref:sugar transferase n=1 Tax=Aestuariivita boseongensis TaxID=1470562 RepID=UPI0009E4355E|nr:sugar transferase [Aestuariivita boseongensis]
MAFRDYSEVSSKVIGVGSISPELSGDSFRNRSRPSFYRDVVKRFLDVLLVVLTLPIWLPVTLLVMALAAFDGGAPVYFQKRIGRGGRVFSMIKIRTMVRDAEDKLEQQLRRCAKSRKEWDETQKLKSDPRITRVGRFLRKSSLDELPQLINVLKGDMSLVGPRPMMVSQRELYPGTSYFDLRPGITGLWQVSDRNHANFSERARFDDEYLACVSLREDISILLRTVPAVLRGTGY